MPENLKHAMKFCQRPEIGSDLPDSNSIRQLPAEGSISPSWDMPAICEHIATPDVPPIAAQRIPVQPALPERLEFDDESAPTQMSNLFLAYSWLNGLSKENREGGRASAVLSDRSA